MGSKTTALPLHLFMNTFYDYRMIVMKSKLCRKALKLVVTASKITFPILFNLSQASLNSEYIENVSSCRIFFRNIEFALFLYFPTSKGLHSIRQTVVGEKCIAYQHKVTKLA